MRGEKENPSFLSARTPTASLNSHTDVMPYWHTSKPALPRLRSISRNTGIGNLGKNRVRFTPSPVAGDHFVPTAVCPIGNSCLISRANWWRNSSRANGTGGSLPRGRAEVEGVGEDPGHVL